MQLLLITCVYGINFILGTHSAQQDSTTMSPDSTMHPKATLTEYATVKEITTSDVRQFHKRQDNVVRYQITLDNETFTVTLRPNQNLFTPGCLVHSYLPGGKKDIYPCSRERLDCYYTGSSDAHNESWVAANICNGLNGVINYNKTSLFIEPIYRTQSGEASIGNVHVVHRFQGDKHVCPIKDNTFDNHLHVVYGRQKRAPEPRYIDARIVVDPNMYHSHRGRDNITEYTLMTFNIASKLYTDPSIGTPVYLRLSELHIISTYNDFASELTRNGNRTLQTFCDWQAKLTTEADCSVLLTSIDIETDEGNNGLNGLSYLRQMCKKKLHCAVVQDEGPIMGITMAHEIGHLLGMTHDNTSLGSGIMSSGGWSGQEAFTWSSQSARELQSSLMSGKMSCLKKGSEKDLNEFKSELSLPGTLYTADQQCKMKNNDSYIFSLDTKNDPCKNIRCRHLHNNPQNLSSPLMDGTDCNNTRMWCIRGQCVAIDEQHASISPVDGAWSMWDTDYTACSRSCGGGVLIKRRYCNNPPPQYGGRECPGMSARGRICNAQACETNNRTEQVDYRTEQCSKISNTSNWVAFLGYQDGESSCIKRCTNNGTFMFGAHYSDGTECLTLEPAAFSRCVDGKCLSFGCDGRLNSGLKYDKCGVCNGTGSTCTEITGTYNRTYLAREYTNVTVIPAGSSGIYIQQRNSYCFLSILIEGRRITDMEQSGPAVFNIHGIELRYTKLPEAIEIVGKITSDIILQVFRLYDYRKHAGVNVSPDIFFTYYIPESEVQLYAWAEVPTQTCSRSCGTGYTYKAVRCMNAAGHFVDDYHCGIHTKPEITKEICNVQPCPPRWKAYAWGDCSLPCGAGTKSRSVTCVRLINGDDQVIPAIRCERLGLPKPHHTSPCNNVCEWRVGAWSKCSKTCGNGNRRREVRCVRVSDGTDVESPFCDQTARPGQADTCTNGQCDADGSCTDDVRCEQISLQYCHSPEYTDWMRTNCPLRCGFVCKDCVDCSMYDSKYCIDKNYMHYMKMHCAKTCGICSGA